MGTYQTRPEVVSFNDYGFFIESSNRSCGPNRDRGSQWGSGRRAIPETSFREDRFRCLSYQCLHWWIFFSLLFFRAVAKILRPLCGIMEVGSNPGLRCPRNFFISINGL